jgi:hypothetical protein
MEDIIPLIIVIAISIIGALSRKKKRQEHENISKPEQRIRRDDDFFGWLEKLNIVEDEEPVPDGNPFMRMDKGEELPAKSAVVKETIVKQEIPNIFSKYSGFISPEERENLMSKEGIPTVVKKTVIDGDLTKQKSEESIEIEKMPKFEIDLRKAVIYNEILNRKYI